MIRVVYDACVLYSPSIRDILLYIALSDGVCAHWSEDIHEEWIHAILRNRPDITRSQLSRARRAMDASATKGGLTKGYEKLISTLDLPDQNDRHVLALAIHANCSLIVTFNLIDFPSRILSTYGIDAICPDEFVFRLSQSNSIEVISAARLHRSSLKRPPKTVHEFLETLEKQGLEKTVSFLREHKDEI